MMKKNHVFSFPIIFLFVFTVSFAQDFGNQPMFDEFTYRQGNVYRTASGKPGPEYWQNSADYTLKTTLHPDNHTVTGEVTIKYTNNSPEDLDFIWLYLEQNRFTEDSRGTLTTPVSGNRYSGDVEGGFKLENILARTKTGTSAKHVITDTRMQVFLDQPLSAKGGVVEISMDFSFKVPLKGMDRMGRLAVEQGTVYAIAQWYPRVAVFDDVVGWNIEPYLGAGEFYCEYGDFDVKIKAPANHTVVASGKLQNPQDVLTETQQDRWAKAEKSEKTVYIIKPGEVGKKGTYLKDSGNLTWHFKMNNTRDVAWAASNAFIWDAARVNLPEGKSTLAQSVYPKESAGKNGWDRSTEFTKASIEFYSENYYPYPYDNAINVACGVGGMEYPGVSFCEYNRSGEQLWSVTDHEFGHNWFPMIVGSNERRYPWLDEGLNMYINHYSTVDFNKGEFRSSTDMDKPRNLIGYLTYPKREGINTSPEVAQDMNLGYTAYWKPAAGFFMLREYIIGKERFDYAIKSYIDTWAYKHPQPNDFFNHIENAVGENLDWFWKGWFYGNGNIDLGISTVKEHTDGSLIVLENKGEIPMPVELLVTFEDNTTETVKLPVEIWHRGNSWEHLLKTKKQVKRVVFDPNQMVPDINMLNNTWNRG